LQGDDFSGLSRLQRLFLNHNALSALPEGVFSGLDSLHSLYLSNNALSALPEGFSSLSSLHSLYLDNNSLSTLSEGFSGLDRLSEISLTGNALSALPKGVFAGLYRLEALRLAGNRLSALPEDVFAGLPGLRFLDLTGNALSTLPKGVFSGLYSLEALWLEDNPGSPFTLTIKLERTDNTDNTAPGPATVVVKLAEGAPFDMTVNLSAQGGTLSATTATISSGHTASEAVVVTQTGAEPAEQGYVEIDLSKAKPGINILEVEIKDLVTGKSATREIRFQYGG
jgi:hypothetical protein